MIEESQQEFDARMMRLALDQAALAAGRGEVPVGAVITCGRRVVARAHNMTEALCDVTAHAEMQAITSAASGFGGKYLPQCCLYVTVEPCIMCAGALGWSQIGRIVYGASDPKKGFASHYMALGSPSPLHPRTVVESGLMADECSAVIRDFFRSRR